MILDILPHIEKRRVFSNVATSLFVAVHLALVNKDVQNEVDDGLSKNSTDIDSVWGFNFAEKIKYPVLSLWLAFAGDKPALDCESHDAIEEVPRTERIDENISVVLDEAAS